MAENQHNFRSNKRSFYPPAYQISDAKRAKIEAMIVDIHLEIAMSSESAGTSDPSTPVTSRPCSPRVEKEISTLERLVSHFQVAVDQRMEARETLARERAVTDYLYSNRVTPADVELLVPAHVFRHDWTGQMATNIALFHGRGDIKETELEAIRTHLVLQAVAAPARGNDPRIRQCQRLLEIVSDKVAKEKARVEERILAEQRKPKRQQPFWVKKHPWGGSTKGKSDILIRREERRRLLAHMEQENQEMMADLDKRSAPISSLGDKADGRLSAHLSKLNVAEKLV